MPPSRKSRKSQRSRRPRRSQASRRRRSRQQRTKKSATKKSKTNQRGGCWLGDMLWGDGKKKNVNSALSPEALLLKEQIKKKQMENMNKWRLGMEQERYNMKNFLNAQEQKKRRNNAAYFASAPMEERPQWMQNNAARLAARKANRAAYEAAAIASSQPTQRANSLISKKVNHFNINTSSKVINPSRNNMRLYFGARPSKKNNNNTNPDKTNYLKFDGYNNEPPNYTGRKEQEAEEKLRKAIATAK